MAGRNDRVSMYTTGSGETDGRNGDPKRNLWTSMLESVASGKRLPEKNLLVLGKIWDFLFLHTDKEFKDKRKEKERNKTERKGKERPVFFKC